MNRKRITIKRVLIVLGASVLICGGISLAGLYVLAHSMSSLGEWLSYDGGCLEWWGGPDNPAAIQQGAHLTLPSSVENLFAHSVAFQDCVVFVSFDMVSHDLDSFLTSTYVTELSSISGAQLATTSFGNMLGHDVDWTFTDNQIYLYGQGSDGSQEYQNIVVDKIDADTYTVYVVTLLL